MAAVSVDRAFSEDTGAGGLPVAGSTEVGDLEVDNFTIMDAMTSSALPQSVDRDPEVYGFDGEAAIPPPVA